MKFNGRIIIIILTLLSSSVLFGQVESKPQLFSKGDVFHGIGVSSFVDLITSPAVPARVQNGVLPDQRSPRMVDSYAQTVATSMLTIFYEYRANIFEPSDNLAVGISALPAVGLSYSRPAEALNGIEGFGHLQLALLGKVYIGQSATKNKSNNYGINIGLGYEVNKIGLVSNRNYQSHEEVPNPIFLMPTLSLGLNTVRYGAPVELNVKVGRGPVNYVEYDRFGFPIQRRATSSFSLRLAVIYMLD
jgi:hypothetical protein